VGSNSGTAWVGKGWDGPSLANHDWCNIHERADIKEGGLNFIISHFFNVILVYSAEMLSSIDFPDHMIHGFDRLNIVAKHSTKA